MDTPENITYIPIPELQKSDADVQIFFLSAPDIFFMNTVEDPWFSAHKPRKIIVGSELGKVKYSSYWKDEPVSAVACTSQVQYCRPSSNSNSHEPDHEHCKPPHGYRTRQEWWAETFSDHQTDIFRTWINFLAQSDPVVMSILMTLKASVLVARSSLYGGAQARLPNNQWQIEVENLVSASLATIQGHMVEAVRGPTPGMEQIWVRPEKNDTVAWNLCNNQVCGKQAHEKS